MALISTEDHLGEARTDRAANRVQRQLGIDEDQGVMELYCYWPGDTAQCTR